MAMCLLQKPCSYDPYIDEWRVVKQLAQNTYACFKRRKGLGVIAPRDFFFVTHVEYSAGEGREIIIVQFSDFKVEQMVPIGKEAIRG